MPRPRKNPVVKAAEAPKTIKTKHQWKISVDKYSFNLEHWVEVPDPNTGNRRMVIKPNDTKYFGTLEQVATHLRDTGIRAYLKQGDDLVKAIEKSTEALVNIFKGFTDCIEVILETDVAQTLIKEKNKLTNNEDEEELESDDEDESQ